jgi:ABC-type transport system involved in multi-copper enzyme maturation permease subunit
MLRLVGIDLKRLFSNRISLALVILAPVISLALLASIVAPLFFSNKLLSRIQVAIFLEDPSEDLNLVMNNITENDRINSLVDFLFVDSLPQGISAARQGTTAIFIHIPPGFVDQLYSRKSAQLEVWISPDYTFEAAILMPIVTSVMEGFNGIQTGLDVTYWRMVDELTSEAAYTHYDKLVLKLAGMLLNREGMFTIQGVSPLGRLLPLEYYISAIFAFFIALGVVPLSGYNAADFTSAALSRGLASTHWRYKYLVARILSGTIYILIISLPMLIVGGAIYGQKALYSGNLLALLGVHILSCLCFSTVAVLLALLFSKGDTSVWVGFYFVLLAALAGGVIFPDNYLPDLLVKIGFISPLRASMNGFAVSLFNFNLENMEFPALSLLVWLVVCFGLCLPLFNQRVRS